MIVTMKPILEKARKEGYAVIAANVFDETTIRAALKAAVNKKSPIILNIAAPANPDIVYFSKMCKDMAEKVDVPVAINLDHGPDYATILKAIDADFTSVMVDRSMLEYDENVAQVSEIVKIAHTCGLSVEAELGHVGSGSNYAVDGVNMLTDPKVAKEYVEQTGVDCLAIAIGTAHGKYVGTPHIDFERLEAIAKEVSIPLVLHGGSGSGDENLAKVAKMGIAKINICTDLCENGRKYMAEGRDAKGRGLMDERAMQPLPCFYAGYQDKVEYYMDLFGSTNKA